MAWTTPPTFTNNTVLTAANLNIIRDDLLHLNGLITGVNVPFTSAIMTGAWGVTAGQWAFKRVGRYLHYRARVTDSDTSDFSIWINGQKQYEDLVQRNNPYTYSGYIDLTSLTATTVNVGDVYSVYTEGDWASGAPRELIVDYFWESDSTTL